MDGRSITCYLRPGVSREFVRLALFGRVLSLALHLQGVHNFYLPGVSREFVRLALFGRVLSLALHLQVPNLHGSAVAITVQASRLSLLRVEASPRWRRSAR